MICENIYVSIDVYSQDYKLKIVKYVYSIISENHQPFKDQMAEIEEKGASTSNRSAKNESCNSLIKLPGLNIHHYSVEVFCYYDLEVHFLDEQDDLKIAQKEWWSFGLYIINYRICAPD